MGKSSKTKRRRKLTDLWGIEPGSPKVYTRSVQRHLMLIVRPLWIGVLASSVGTLLCLIVWALGLRAAAVPFVFASFVFAWMFSVFFALVASHSAPERTLTAWYRP